ncbi:MAG: sensor domain-containing diguanylate cyclase, partial [Lachnospiraceae bacterium]|nr:sensor domain-containing diguanylate cyclase [Lachnospiraceae bacterium]
EFVAIVKNTDYQIKEELLYTFRKEVENKSRDEVPFMNRISVASGMADCEEIENDDIESIFRIADERMYENKRLMKAERGK